MKKIMISILLTVTMMATAHAGIIPSGLTDTGTSLFTLTDANANLDDSGFSMLFEYGEFNSFDHAFGVYQYNVLTDTIGGSVDIFRSADNIGSSSNLVWDLANSTASTQYGSFNLGLGLAFGLYFESDGDTYYSQSQFNAGGQDFFSFFWQNDPYAINNLYVKAWDNGSSWWTNDSMTVGISDVKGFATTTGTPTPVPEPATLMLLGLALVGMRVLHTNTKHNC